MTEQQSSYRQIMKATSLFGGVQVFNIIINIVRSKIIAVLLGPAGMGIVGLLNSTTGLISGLTNFGLGTSAVKDIASANESGDENRISTVIAVFRRLVWITGLLGSIATLVLSHWLSILTFGNSDYTLAFVWLSITLLFNQLTSGQDVLLQGMRKLQYLAKANLAGSLLGLLVSVPVYYFMGIRGIVPAIILSSFFLMAIAWYFARKIKIEKVTVSRQITYSEGKGMLKMGFMLSLSGIIGMGASYLLRIFISNTGGVAEVGLYSAGFNIIGTYVGLVFTAMGTDYYPRLSGIAHDNRKATTMINQQAEIAVLILAPILCVFLVFINWVVILLYSTKFVAVNGMIHWAALGMFFKAASWSIAFVFLAKSASKLFFWNELISSVYLLGFNMLGYKYAGLDGLGISFLVTYILYFLQVYLITHKIYAFSLDKAFIQIISIQLLIAVTCFLIVKFLTAPYSYIAGTLLIIISVGFSLNELNKRMDLKQIVSNFRRK
jgi:O-antigen/teichoic acid export membrane protein